MLAERLQITPDEAFVALRRYSRNNNKPLTQLAREVISGISAIAGVILANPRPAASGQQTES